MEISKKERILNIVFTCVIFVLMSMTYFGTLFGDLIEQASNVPGYPNASFGFFGTNGLIKTIQNFFETIQNTSGMPSDVLRDYIQGMFSYFVVFFAYIVVAIIMTVFFIISIVRGVQVLSNKRSSKDFFGTYTKFVFPFFNFVMIVFLCFWRERTITSGIATFSVTVGLGSGLTMALVASFIGLSVLIAGKFLYPSKRSLIVRIFSSVMIVLATVVLVYVFIDGVQYTSLDLMQKDKTTVFRIFSQVISANSISELQQGILKMSIGIMGFVLTIIGVNSFVRNICFDEFEINEERYLKVGRKFNTAQHSMVQAILAFAFTTVGLLLSTIMYCSLYYTPETVYHVSTMPVVVIIMLSIVLGFAIANKCIDHSGEEQPAKVEPEPKAE